MLDADELDRSDNYDDDAKDKGVDPNHVVHVLRIDRSDPNNPMVIMNDSGRTDGDERAIPLKQFMDAWGDSGFYAIVTTEPAPPLACEIPLSAMDTEQRNANLRAG